MTKTIIEKFRINIDLPGKPKGEIFYHEYEIKPSLFKENEQYATDGKWYQLVDDYKNGEIKMLVWPWIGEFIRTCRQMRGWDKCAKKYVTKLKQDDTSNI